MQSIWKQTSTSPEAYQKSRESETETIVIGAGMAGIVTAWFLQAQGSPVIVLEANTVGSGQTGNTTAKITSQHGLIYQKLLSSFGIEKAAQYARANEEAIANYQKLAKELEIDCGFEVHPAFLYTSRDADPLKREEEAAQKAGIRASFLRETELPFPVTGALRFENQAWFHPLKFLYALAGKLSVYEHTRVLRVNGNFVETTSGTYTGKNIVFATHYPFINRPGYYFMRMHQERSYAMALEGASQMDGMYLGIDPDGLSFRNFEELLLVGGEGHRTGENRIGGQYGKLYKKAEEYWPGVIEKARWSAQDCMTLDGVPYVGRFSESRPDWYVATGFGKWGMTGSMIAAKLLSGEILQIRDKSREIFSPQRSALQASTENFLKDLEIGRAHV